MTVPVDDSSPFGTYRPNAAQRRLYRLMPALYRSGWPGRRLFGRLRWLDRTLAADGIADVERFGLRWRLYRRGNVSDSRLLLRPDSFDPVEMALLLPRVRPGFAFVDVGANCGFYALRVAAAGGRAVAVEPHPQMFRRLRFNAAQNPGCALSLLNCAAGARPGRVALAEDGRNLGRTRIAEAEAADGETAHGETGGVDTGSTELRPLLDIVRGEGLARLDALKVDVEGYEDRVLAPYLRAAPDALLPGVIVAEHTWSGAWAADWRQTAAERGYRERARTPTGNLILIRPADPA